MSNPARSLRRPFQATITDDIAARLPAARRLSNRWVDTMPTGRFIQPGMIIDWRDTPPTFWQRLVRAWRAFRD